MGRPRLYHTKEEKLAADRAKRSRYYHAHKDNINHRVRIAYRQRRNQDIVDEKRRAHDEANAPMLTPDMVSLMDDMSRAASQIRMLTGGSVSAYAGDLIIEEEVMVISDLQERLHKTSSGILQEFGANEEFKEIDSRCAELREITVFIEDIYMKAMLGGPKAVGLAHQQRKFMYQRYTE